MSRPLVRDSIASLEASFERRQHDPAFVQLLLRELEYRKTDRALRLRRRVVDALAARDRESVRPSPAPSTSAPPTVATAEPRTRAGSDRPVASRPSPAADDETHATPQPPPAEPFPPQTNAPDAILAAWTALEVLSPPAFRRPEDLAAGDRSRVAVLTSDALPWEKDGEKSLRNTRLYYHVVLGTLALDAAVTQLVKRFGDPRLEAPRATGHAVLATVLLDREGRPAGPPAASVASVAWAVPIALRGSLADLAGWTDAEAGLTAQLETRIRRTNRDGTLLPLDWTALIDAHDWLVRTLGLPRATDLVRPPSFAIREYQFSGFRDPPDALLLNSLILNDLAKARACLRSQRAPTALRLYLGALPPPARVDLSAPGPDLEQAVAPSRVPPARWPGRGRHSLALLQQAAVNLAHHTLREEGLIAINGPPGTGKTTLLRDIVAAVVADRADVMATFEHPSSAFVPSGQTLRHDDVSLVLSRIDPRLRGFEMVVASSNNKAVENVSMELPGLSAIADDAMDLRYLATVSDALRGTHGDTAAGDTWGLIAAVLGNASNRYKFRQSFWQDKERSVRVHLAAAAGASFENRASDPAGGPAKERVPIIVSRERSPRSIREAEARWREARAAFLAQRDRVHARLRELADVRAAVVSLSDLHESARIAADAVAPARDAAETAAQSEAAADAACVAAETAHAAADDRLRAIDGQRPGLVHRLLRTPAARAWSQARGPLQQRAQKTAIARERRRDDHRRARAALKHARQQAVDAERCARDTAECLAAAQAAIANMRMRLGAHFAGPEFFAQAHEPFHLSVPWLDAQTQRARDDLFVSAMHLHRTFMDAAAVPLRQNLTALMRVFNGPSFADADRQALMPDLWASLFLVVPLVSTTFASVERMFRTLPPASLGWLLIDEAGQALPQAPVGALLRARRAVVIGDPMQIEPIVMLPPPLTQAVCSRFGVDPERFNAPEASAQTLADAGSSFMAAFETLHGRRIVGAPLLVHRRCAEPMFGIANAIAYGHLMVQAKPAGASAIRRTLGASRWIDVRGGRHDDKWCPEEGDVCLELLRRLRQAGVPPNVYVISPFVIVVERLRAALRTSRMLDGWVPDAMHWPADRVGTIHTVQGREAEAVILVLGAPAASQAGARNWAGGRPNLLNVAVTRAQEVLYVIGDRSVWADAGVFRELALALPPGEERGISSH